MAAQSVADGHAGVMEPPVRVFLRPLGSPLAVGMSGLAIASFVQSGLDLGWVANIQALQVGLALIAVPFVLQLLASVFSYLARDGAVGSAVGVLATTWLALGLMHIISASARASGATGLTLVAAGGVLALSAVAVSLAKPLPGTVFLAAGVRFILAGVYGLTARSSWEHVAGIAGLVVTAGAAYCVLAFELEGQRRRPVLPTFRRGLGKSAITEPGSTQVDGVVHEAGVRLTT